MGKEANLLPLLCVLFLNCSLEAFKAFASPYLYGKRASSPSRFLRRQARHEIYESIFSGSQDESDRRRRTSKRRSYLTFASQLSLQSERWAQFHSDEILTIILLVEQHLRGFVCWDDIDAFSFLLDNELHADPTHPPLVLSNLFLQLVTQLYDRLQLSSLSSGLKSRVRELIKTVRRKTRLQPLDLLLRNISQLEHGCWEGPSDECNQACLSTVQQLVEAIRAAPEAVFLPPTPSPGEVASPPAPQQTTSPVRLTASPARLRIEELGTSPTPLNSPAEAKALLRDSVRSLELRARELGTRLEQADDVLAADQALWESLQSLNSEVRQALTVGDYLVTQSPPPPAAAGETAATPSPPPPPTSSGPSGGEEGGEEDGRSTTVSTMTSVTASTAPRRLFNSANSRLRSFGPSQLTYEGLLTMQGQSSLPSRGGKPLSQSEILVQKFRSRYAEIKQVYDVDVTPRRKANLSIIRSPLQRQQSGNTNYYDPQYMRWQASQQRHNPHEDRILDVSERKDLQYYRQVYTMFHHSR